MNINMHPIEIRFEAIGKNVVPDIRLVRLDRCTTEILIGRVRRDDPEKREKPDNLLIDNKTVSRVHAWLILEEVDNIYLKVRDENDAEKAKRLDGRPCRTHTYLNDVELNHGSRHKLDKTGTITFGFSGYEARDEYNNFYRTKASNWRYTWKSAARSGEARPAPSNENAIITKAAAAKHTTTNTFRAPSYISSDEDDSDYYDSPPAPSVRVSASPIELSDDESEDEVSWLFAQSSVPTVASTEVPVIDLTEGNMNSNNAAQREWSIRDWNNPAINTIPIHDSDSPDSSSDFNSEMSDSPSEESIISGTKARLQAHVEEAARVLDNEDSEEYSEVDHSDCANCGGYDEMENMDDYFEGFESDASMEAQATSVDVDEQRSIPSPYKTIEEMRKRIGQERAQPGSIPGFMIHGDFAARRMAAEAAIEKELEYPPALMKRFADGNARYQAATSLTESFAQDGTPITEPALGCIMKQQGSGATQHDSLIDRRFVAKEALGNFAPSEFYPQLPKPVDRRSPTAEGGEMWTCIGRGVSDPKYTYTLNASGSARSSGARSPEDRRRAAGNHPLGYSYQNTAATNDFGAFGFAESAARPLAASPSQREGSLLMASSLCTPEVYDHYKSSMRNDGVRTILTCPSGAVRKNGGKALSIKELVGDNTNKVATGMAVKEVKEHKAAEDIQATPTFTSAKAGEPTWQGHNMSPRPVETQKARMNFEEYAAAHKAHDNVPLGLIRKKMPTGSWMEDLKNNDEDMVRSLGGSGMKSPKRKADDISELVAEETEGWRIPPYSAPIPGAPSATLLVSSSLASARVANNDTATATATATTSTDPGVSNQFQKLIAHAKATLKAEADKAKEEAAKTTQPATKQFQRIIAAQKAAKEQEKEDSYIRIDDSGVATYSMASDQDEGGEVSGGADTQFQKVIAAQRMAKEQREMDVPEVEETAKLAENSQGTVSAIAANKQFQRPIIAAPKKVQEQLEREAAEVAKVAEGEKLQYAASSVAASATAGRWGKEQVQSIVSSVNWENRMLEEFKAGMAERDRRMAEQEERPRKVRRLTRVAEAVGCAALGAAAVFAALVATAPEDFM